MIMPLPKMKKRMKIYNKPLSSQIHRRPTNQLQPFSRSTMSSNNIITDAASEFWNKIPTQIKILENKHTFNKYIKAFYLKNLILCFNLNNFISPHPPIQFCIVVDRGTNFVFMVQNVFNTSDSLKSYTVRKLIKGFDSSWTRWKDKLWDYTVRHDYLALKHYCSRKRRYYAKNVKV